MKVLKLNQGSLTVEASLVFPIVMLSIAMVIFMSFLMYQYIYTETIVNLVAERSVAVQQNVNVEIATGRIRADELEKPLYFMHFSEEKKNNIKNYLVTKLERFELVKPEQRTIKIINNSHFIYQTLEIKVTANYKLPAGRIFNFIGLRDGITRTTQSRVIVFQPEGLIRDVNLMFEILQLQVS